MLALLALVLGASFFGFVLLGFLELFREKVQVLAAGLLTGLATLTTLSYGLSTLRVPAGAAHGLAWLALVAVASVPRWRSPAVAHWNRCGLDPLAAAIWGAVTVGFLPIGSKLLFFKDGELWTGVISAYGDVAWHVSNILAFQQGQGFPPENPIFSGHALVYPFLINYLSGGLVSLGATVSTAVNGPVLLLVPLLVTLYYVFVRELTGRRKVAALAALLLMGGGAFLGWTRIFADFAKSGRSLFDFALHLAARDLSGVGMDAEGFHFVNPVTTLLLPQRAFLFGLPLAFLILLLWIRGEGRRSAVVAGALMGMLPLFHAHTVLALVPALVLGTSKVRWKDAPAAILAAAVLGIPEAAYFLRFGPLGSHLSTHFGWLSGTENFVWYWFKNTGFVFPLALVAWRFRLPRDVKFLAAAGLFLFALGNVFQFARWTWDNYKILIYAWLFCVPAALSVGIFFAEKYRTWWSRGMVHGIFVLHLISGALDTWKVWLPTAPQYGEWDPDAIRAADLIRRQTPAGSRFVNAPIHNSPVFLAGRISYLGYPAHVWSHGGEPWAREGAIRQFFLGARPDLPEAPVDFALVGPVERRLYPGLRISDRWSLVFRSGAYALYRLSVVR